MREVQRFDFSRVSERATKTAQGFLRVPARFTRTGVLEYRQTDGTIRRELRLPEEVFAEDSVATLAAAPVTNRHPGMLNPENARAHMVGVVGERVERQDAFLGGSLTIMDAAVIKAVEGRELREVSAGYRCGLDESPGTHPEYGRYDAIQRRITYNHVALGPDGWGRAGSDVALRLDGADSACAVEPLPAHDNQSAPERGQQTHHDGGEEDPVKETIKINGVEYEVDKAAAQAYRAEVERRDAADAETRKNLETLQGRFDSAEEELEKAKKALSEAQDPGRFDSAIQERISLMDGARKVLGPEADLVGKSPREIQEMVIRKDSPELDLSDHSDDYVRARFDARVELVDTSKEAPHPDLHAARKAAGAAVGAPRQDARERMIQEYDEAWKKPLSVSKDHA